MFFLKPSAKKLATLIKERELYILYTAMEFHSDSLNFENCPELEYERFKNSRLQFYNPETPLRQRLLKSQDLFLEKASQVLGAKLTLRERSIYQKQFDDLILSSDNSLAVFETMNHSLYSFLCTLCDTQAKQSLTIFIKKYPHIIHRLNPEKFNSICVRAAFNHMYDFLAYLCTLGYPIDEYSYEPYGDRSIFDCVITPFNAVCDTIVTNSNYSSMKLIDNTKNLIDLLLKYGANPHKRYSCDDASEEELWDFIKQDNTYGTSVAEILIHIQNTPQLKSELQADGFDIQGFEQLSKHLRAVLENYPVPNEADDKRCISVMRQN